MNWRGLYHKAYAKLSMNSVHNSKLLHYYDFTKTLIFFCLGGLLSIELSGFENSTLCFIKGMLLLVGIVSFIFFFLTFRQILNRKNIGG